MVKGKSKTITLTKSQAAVKESTTTTTIKKPKRKRRHARAGWLGSGDLKRLHYKAGVTFKSPQNRKLLEERLLSEMAQYVAVALRVTDVNGRCTITEQDIVKAGRLLGKQRIY